MQINAVCPHCQTSYQLDAALVGQTIRCPNPDCRRVFVVSILLNESAPPKRTTDVADLIPILSAEAVEEPAEVLPLETIDPPRPEPREAASWEQPPPVRSAAAPPARPAPKTTRTDSSPVTRRTDLDRKKTQPKPSPEAPVELAPGAWEAPPIRSAAVEPEPVSEPSRDGHHEPLPPTRRAGWLLFLIPLFTLGLVGGVGAWLWTKYRVNEDDLFKQAHTDYKDGNHALAEKKFKQLTEKFAASDRKDEYAFWGTLSGLRAQASPPAKGGLELVDGLIDYHARPFFKDNVQEVVESLDHVLTAFIQASQQPTSGEPEAIVFQARQLIRSLTEAAPGAISLPTLEKWDKGLGDVVVAVDRYKRYEKAMQRLRDVAKGPPGPAILGLQNEARAAALEFPGIDQSPEVVSLLNGLYDRHLRSVVWEDADADLPPPAIVRDDLTSILFDPVLQGSPKPNGDDGIVLALVRGVLYGQRRSTGEVLWAMRVGVDTNTLPVRVPARPRSGLPELILVPSADTETLTGLLADGRPLWQYPLGGKCQGKPLVVEKIAYVATANGVVHAIELAAGKLIGRWKLGHELSNGGARQEGTDLLYFPANDTCVYVLDAKDRQNPCKAILYSNHPESSLRGEPLIVTPGDPEDGPAAAPGYLILNQKSGLDEMQLKVYALPIEGRNPQPVPISPEPRVLGWSWFQPFHDPEKVVMLTDAAMVGMFGIRQARNRDPALFSWLPGSEAGVSLERFVGPRPRWSRAEVVNIQGPDFWVLACGRLQRITMGWTAGGPVARVHHQWELAPPRMLGSAVHASQVVEDKQQFRSTLYLVTEPLRQHLTLSTAVDDEDAAIRWQRQLGMVSQGEPMLLAGGADDGPPWVLALDQGGSLFLLDPEKFPSDAKDAWLTGAKMLAGPLDSNPAIPPRLVPGPAGSAYQVACPGDGKQLVIRHVARVGDQPKFKEYVVKLEAPLAGLPALVGGKLLLPLADGVVYRLPLPLGDDRGPAAGPDWRARRAGSDATGHVVALQGDEFVTTDGQRGLTRWRWKGGDADQCEALPPDRLPTVRLQSRIASAPVVLPPSKADGPSRVVAVDSSCGLYLLDAPAGGGLEGRAGRQQYEVLPQINLGGKEATAGPYLVPDAAGKLWVACVIDRTRLVWIDPDKEKVVWEYQTGSAVVGSPRRVDDRVVVADLSGKYVGLNPADGKPVGPGYTLKANVTPASSPVAFGAGRAFAPLSDGTVLLLPLERLR